MAKEQLKNYHLLRRYTPKFPKKSGHFVGPLLAEFRLGRCVRWVIKFNDSG